MKFERATMHKLVKQKWKDIGREIVRAIKT